eukprot:TRINITY_DN13304_c0_g1_i1.p1 TRINITY_DN13304_c0_g1~~TRINITY_DN13304_c0_g1_i1.p1  ORF type:complete len:314 (+),score=79.95 TRINITY_DN13304_c0_g1_i1:54-944(+)
MERRIFRVAVAQLRVTKQKDHNLDVVRKLTKEAKQKDCEMIFFPENVDFIGDGREETLGLSEPLEGKTINEYKQIAKECNIWMNLGGVHELVTNTMIANTQLVLSSEGEIVTSYRKAHLFDVGRYRESNSTIPGVHLKVSDTPIGRIGLTTCYDLRFSYQYTALAKSNSQIITVPSAFMVPTGKAHWHVLLKSRAIETQNFIIASAQCGAHNDKRSSYGHSLVVDPWGNVLLDMEQQQNVIGVVDLDYGAIVKARSTIPMLHHTRELSWEGEMPPPLSGFDYSPNFQTEEKDAQVL